MENVIKSTRDGIIKRIAVVKDRLTSELKRRKQSCKKSAFSNKIYTTSKHRSVLNLQTDLYALFTASLMINTSCVLYQTSTQKDAIAEPIITALFIFSKE